MQESLSALPNPTQERPAPGRLRRTREFTRVMRSGRRARGPLVHVAAVATGGAETRIGLAVSRQVGTAVVRNRVKRRLRMTMRALPWLPGFDVVIVAQPGIDQATFQEIERALRQRAHSIGLLADGKP